MDEVEQKQKYLCDNILEQGYDAEDFAEFCERFKGNMDITSWTFQELEEIVGKYVESKKNPAHNDHEASFIDYQQEQESSPPAAQREPPAPLAPEPPAINMKKKDSPVRPPSPVYVQPPAPVRPPKPEVNVEELFRDPFAKVKEKPMGAASTWGTGSWGSTVKQPTTAPTAKEFNFADLLGPSVSATTSPVKAVGGTAHTTSLGNSPPSAMQPSEYQLKPPAAMVRQPLPPTKPQPKQIESFQPIKIDNSKQNITDLFSNFGSPPPANGQPAKVAVPKSYVGPAAVSKPVGNVNIFEMTIDDAPVHKNNHSEPVITNLSGVLPTFQNQKQISESTVRSASHTMSSADLHSSAVVGVGSERSKSQSRPKATQSGIKVVHEEFYDIIPCAKAHTRTLFNTPNVDIVITGHEIVNRNFFVPDYVLYHLLTKGLNIQVKRKYAHFVRLRNMLCKFYPGFRVPYLQKNPWLSETDPEHIRKQKIMIEFFMNDIVMNREFRNCRIVEEFLTLDYKKLKAKLHEYDKLARLKSLEQLCLLTGEVNIAYSDQHRIYCENIGPFLQGMNHHLDKYKRLQEQLTGNYASLIRTYNEIQEVMVTMEAACKGFNAGVNFGEFYEMEQTINSLNEIYRELANSVRFDNKVLEADFKPIFRFEKENMNTIREQLDVRNRMTEAYNRNHQPSNEPYAGNPKLAAFKLAAEEPSKHPTVLKYQNGYYNAQIVMQNMRMFKDMALKLAVKFAHISGQYEERKAEEMGFWQRKKMSALPA